MKAKSTKSKPKKKRSTQTTDPAQSARFLEMAKTVGVDESGEAFARVIETVVKPAVGPARPSAKKRAS